MATDTKIVLAVVLIVLQQVFMKPSHPIKDTVQGPNFEEELEAEARHSFPSQKPKPYQSKSKSTEDWADDVSGIDVGNVIKDVLITLKDHPEIVRKLIDDEEKSLAEKVLSSQKDSDTNGDKDVVVPVQIPPRDFQIPSPQLKQIPKRVVKKMGSGQYAIMKRQKETPEETVDMTNMVEGGSEESTDDKPPLISDSMETSKDKPNEILEGGSDDPVKTAMNGIKRKDSTSSISESEEDSSSDSDDSNTTKKLKGQRHGKAWYWKNYGKQKHEEEKSENWKEDPDMDDSEEGLSKAQYWKNYGRMKSQQRHKQKDSSDNSSDSSSNTNQSESSEENNQSDRRMMVKRVDENEKDLHQLMNQQTVSM